MKNLSSLLQHPAVKGSSLLTIESEKPVTVLGDGGEKQLGKPLTGKNVMSLLKASLPEEVVNALMNEKSLDHTLSVEEVEYDLNVTVSGDDIYLVKITPSGEEVPAEEVAVEAAPEPQEEVDPELIDTLLEGDECGLVYYTDESQVKKIEAFLDNAGHPVRKTDVGAAVTNVLNYHHYPMVIFQMGEDFRKDRTYREMTIMPMKDRRQKFVILVAPGLESGNPALAFSLSVNLVVDSKDVDELEKHVTKALPVWKRHVGVYHEVLADRGKL